MGRPRLSAEQQQQMRARILEAARQEVDRAGVAGLTMRKVAGEAGISPMAIYRYFPAREQLVLALVREGIDELQRLMMACGTLSDPRQRLLALGDAYLDFALSHPHHYTTLFHSVPEAGHLDEYRSVFGQAMLSMQPLAGAVAEITGDPARAMEHATILWSAMHGLVMLHLGRRLEFIGADFEAVRAQMRQQLPRMLEAISS